MNKDTEKCAHESQRLTHDGVFCADCGIELNEYKDVHDMADVCELAHERTIIECNARGILYDMQDGEKYTPAAQVIFDRHYKEITEATGL